jgi:hypothetical protein
MRAEAEPFYREGGEAIGRLLNYHPEEEPRVWLLVAGTGIWKRWYLQAFKSIWRLENPQEYSCIKSARNKRKQRKLTWASRLETSREAASVAMLKPTQPPERPGESQL